MIEDDQDMLSQIRFKREVYKYIPYIGVIMVIVFMMYSLNFFQFVGSSNTSPTESVSTETCHTWEINHLLQQKQCRYSSKYPFTDPVRLTLGRKGLKFKIAAIADLDEERSKVVGAKFTWKSYLKTGYLLKYDNGEYNVQWTKQITLKSKLNEKGRGLELSELCAFNGKLYTVDDRTGLVYRITDDGKVIPWVILMDGDGNSEKGFKSEWMTVKDGSLYIGGLGKEWTTKEGKFINYHPLFVKSIDQNGGVVHHNWTNNFIAVRAKAGVYFPGYMIHEAVMWSHIKKRWFFLPRRMSKVKYDDVADERRGTNVLISCRADFTDFQLVYVGILDPTHGFSSFKFVPGNNDNIAVALKSEEVEGSIQSYIMVFDVNTGKVKMSETFVANDKYEGIEFI